MEQLNTNLIGGNKELSAELVGLKIGIQDLREYLALDKFRHDTTVQVQDVLNRLADAVQLSTRLRDEQFVINNTKRN